MWSAGCGGMGGVVVCEVPDAAEGGVPEGVGRRTSGVVGCEGLGKLDIRFIGHRDMRDDREL